MTEEEMRALIDAAEKKAKDAEKEKNAVLSKNGELLDAQSNLKKKYEGIDLEEYKQKKALFDGLDEEEITAIQNMRKQTRDEEEKEIMKTQGVEGLVAHRVRAMEEKHNREIAAAAEAAEKANKKVAEMTAQEQRRNFEGLVSAAIAQNGKFIDGIAGLVANDLIRYVEFTDDEDTGYRIKWEGKTFRSENNPQVVGTVAEFVNEVLPKSHKPLLKQSNGFGSNGGDDDNDNGGAPNPFFTGDMDAQAEMRAKNPEKAKKLAQAARAKAGDKRLRMISGV